MNYKNAIQISSISKKFNGKSLFNDFNLDIETGNVHALIGPNGSGKTTLLRLITSLYGVDSGRIKMSGKHAMLLENDYLYEELTGEENIILFGKYFGFESSRKSFEEYSDLLELTEHLDKRVSTYSKGMKRKLSMLVVILMKSEIILLDEPTSGVDPISRVQIRNLITQIKDEGKTVLITSHDLSEIEKIADKVTMIKKGKILFNSDIDTLKGESLEKIFIEEGLNEI